MKTYSVLGNARPAVKTLTDAQRMKFDSDMRQFARAVNRRQLLAMESARHVRVG